MRLLGFQDLILDAQVCSRKEEHIAKEILSCFLEFANARLSLLPPHVCKLIRDPDPSRLKVAHSVRFPNDWRVCYEPAKAKPFQL